jgi:hypothetical protein
MGRALLLNLAAGARLALLQAPRPGQFSPGLPQAALLLLVNFALYALTGLAVTEPPVSFNAVALEGYAASLFWFLLAVFLASAALGHTARATELLTAWAALQALPLAWYGAGLASLPLWLPEEAINLGWQLAWGAVNLWLLAAAWRAACWLFALHPARALAAPLLLAVITLGAELLFPPQGLWYTASVEPAPGIVLNQEDVYYAQPEHMQAALDAVLPQRPGVTDLYVIAFGGDGTQDVFLRETEQARALLEERFGAAGRSLLLINNPATADRLPLANRHNLRQALNTVALRMDPQEDVLFLLLSSHGSEQHELAVDMPWLDLNPLPAAELKTLLDEAGIRWRVIVVSACYSGGFIEPLRDERSLILTAARADRQSFGCAHENHWTYFGEAYFSQALPETGDFIRAFERARSLIAERERRERKQPSEPQMHLGTAITAKLSELPRPQGTAD